MSPRSRWSLLALPAAAAIAFAACTAAASPSPSGAASGSPSASASGDASASPSGSLAPFTGEAYPEQDAPCGTEPYGGNLKKITATDRHTVEFQLCNPDAAFLPKVAFSAFGIHDSDWLAENAPNKNYLNEANGTGPYKIDASGWTKGDRMVFTANESYWGEEKPQTPNLELRWGAEAAQRLLALNEGSIDGMDNPGTDDIATIQGNSELAFYERPGLNTLYIGFNRTMEPWDDVNVRKAFALGLNREQLVENYYPEGSTVATHFTPCEIEFGCEGDATWDYNAEEAKSLLQAAGFDMNQTIPLHFRTAVRGYLPDPPQIATAIADQYRANLGVNVEPALDESVIANQAAGTLPGLILLGWGADYPDASNFLDFHFGAGSGKKFGEAFPEVVTALNEGSSTVVDEERRAAYEEANNLIKENVPAVIVAHGASGAAFKADVQGAYASVFGAEVFSRMKPGDRDTLVFMQNAEPLSLYCGDESDGETLRACEQVNESLYRYGGPEGADSVPNLASECAPNETLDVWTCTLQQGVKFHNGADFDANDVVVTYAAAWDTEHPLHVGNTGQFEYFAGLWGGHLNPAATE